MESNLKSLELIHSKVNFNSIYPLIWSLIKSLTGNFDLWIIISFSIREKKKNKTKQKVTIEKVILRFEIQRH